MTATTFTVRVQARDYRTDGQPHRFGVTVWAEDAKGCITYPKRKILTTQNMQANPIVQRMTEEGCSVTEAERLLSAACKKAEKFFHQTVNTEA